MESKDVKLGVGIVLIASPIVWVILSYCFNQHITTVEQFVILGLILLGVASIGYGVKRPHHTRVDKNIPLVLSGDDLLIVCRDIQNIIERSEYADMRDEILHMNKLFERCGDLID